MQVDLSGLRALVTGSTKGIGRAIARELAANGAEVVINGRKAADTEQAVVSLRAALPKGRFKAAPGDAGTAAGVASIIEAAGDVDILVNNVGVFEIKDAFEIPDADWERLFAINVLSGVRFTVSGALSPSCSVRSDPEDVAGLDWIGWHIWLTI